MTRKKNNYDFYDKVLITLLIFLILNFLLSCTYFHIKNINERDFLNESISNLYDIDTFNINEFVYEMEEHFVFIPKGMLWDEKSQIIIQLRDDPCDNRLLHELNQFIFENRNAITDDEKKKEIIKYVQRIPYVKDRRTEFSNEDFKPPIQTLVEGGDCEDLVVLASSMLEQEGYDTIMIFYRTHAALGITGNFSGKSYEYNNKTYYYVEMTNMHSIGYIPSNVETMDMRDIYD